MENKLEKPPDAVESLNSIDQQNNTTASPQTPTTCNCTKISVMLLIHEMKQQYATVPDHIVSQCVMDNCHNRAVLLDTLEREAEKYPGSVQAYPQALRNNKRSLTPRRIAPPVPVDPIRKTNNDLKMDRISSQSPHDSVDIGGQQIKRKFADRPNSLHVAKVSNECESGNGRPNRPAPPPPLPPPNPSPNEKLQSFYNQQLTTTTTTTTPDSNESLNVSLNVMVSPVTGRPPVRPPRHTTAISVHPEPGYPLDPSHNPRSYTSVNFTLRQPGDKPQSPIEITAGPSLTYSSRSYDARAGFQSHLAITVGGSGGSISASRMRPRASAYAELTEDTTRSILSSRNGHQSLPNITATAVSTTTTTSVTTIDKGEIVHRQLLCKQRLSVELENEKKHLQVMLREISVLQSPLPPDGCTTLLDEIERLRSACIQMAQEVEEACPSTALGETNEAFYQNIYTGQRLPIQQNRPSRPQRPPPPYVLRCLSGSMSPSARQHHQLHQQNNYDDNDDPYNNGNIDGGEPWTCNMCTFQNHPLLNKCEQCEMPLLSTSGTVNANTQPPFLTPRLQHIPYQQSVSPVVVPNPMQYNSSIGFNDLPPRLTQQH